MLSGTVSLELIFSITGRKAQALRNNAERRVYHRSRRYLAKTATFVTRRYFGTKSAPKLIPGCVILLVTSIRYSVHAYQS